MSHRRNWVPHPLPPSECVLPRTRRGEATLSCGWGSGGTQFGWQDRKPGTLYTLWCVRGGKVVSTLIKKKIKLSSYKEIQTGAVAKSYSIWLTASSNMTKYLRNSSYCTWGGPSSYMYDFATDPYEFLYERKILLFFYQCTWCRWRTRMPVVLWVSLWGPMVVPRPVPAPPPPGCPAWFPGGGGGEQRPKVLNHELWYSAHCPYYHPSSEKNHTGDLC